MWSEQYELPGLKAFVNIPEPVKQIEDILSNDEKTALKILPFSVNVAINLTPSFSGQWDTIPGKGLVWRIGIHGENARLLDVLIEQFNMSPGMSLYVYDPERTNIEGPYNANNKNNGILPIWPISGDSIIVEWNIPDYAVNRNDFVITSIGYGFRSITPDNGNEKLKAGYNQSLPCNIDINCPEGNHWQREKRSVVHMLVTLTNGKYHCTGTLINQEGNSKRKYILTANHCINTSRGAELALFDFGYERPVCNGNTYDQGTRLTGSKLIATKEELDFTLVELSNDIDYKLKPYYSGWNASTSAPQSGVGIHHPNGDVKKISIDESPLVSSTYPGFDTDGFWKVLRWDKGITQGGSSGSPIFDANHMIVGTLTGGNKDESCSTPTNDYYSKFCEQWNKYPATTTSLKGWLDPDNKGITSLSGYDPYSGIDGDIDTLNHIGINEEKVLMISDGWGYLSGHNDKKWTSFAEKFDNGGEAKIIGLEVEIAKVYKTGSRVKFVIWTGDEFPVSSVYEKDMIIMPEYRNYPMQIYFDKTVELSGNFFAGFTVNYETVVDTFALYQSSRREYPGISAMYVEDGGSWKSLSEEVPPLYSSLGIKVFGQFENKNGQKTLPSEDDLIITSQPGNNFANAYFENPNKNISIECFDITGKKVPVQEMERNIVMSGDKTYLQVKIDISQLSYGMYVIRIQDNKKKQSGKFIKL